MTLLYIAFLQTETPMISVRKHCYHPYQ